MFNRDTFRLIKRTFKRFVTILLMVFIGAGFMVGLMSSSPMLQESVDAYNDEYDLMDIQIYSSFGFCKEDIEAIENTDGVKEVYASKFIDAYGKTSDGMSYVTRVQEIDPEINRFHLIEGEMPDDPWEAVVLGGSDIQGTANIGDIIEIHYDDGDDDIRDSLKYVKYKIVGIVESPLYLAKTMETSTYKNLTLQSVIYVDERNFLADYYTTVYVTVDGAKEAMSYSNEYEDIVTMTKANIENMAITQQEYLKDDLVKEAEEEIADAQKTLDEEVADAQKEIADGEKELKDAYQELIDAEKEVEDGWNEYYDGLKELEDGKKEIEDAEEELIDGQKQLADGRKELENAQAALDEGLQQLKTSFGTDDPNEVLDTINNAQQDIVNIEENIAKLKESSGLINMSSMLVTMIEKAKTTVEACDSFECIITSSSSLNMLKSTLIDSAVSDNLESTKASIEEIIDSLTSLRSLIPLMNSQESSASISEEEVDEMIAKLQEASNGIDSILSLSSEIVSDVNDLLEPREGQEFEDLKEKFIKECNSLSYLIGNLSDSMNDESFEQMEDGLSQLKDASDSLGKYKGQIEELISGQAQLDAGWQEYYDGAAQLNDGRRQLEEAKEELADGEKELKDAYQELIDAEKEIEDGWNEYYDGLKELEDGKKELADEVEEAEIDIAQARQDIADLPEAEWTILDRNENYSHALFDGTVGQMANIGYVFPLLFFLVAALVCLTTMTRLIDEERGQIGIFSALGFSNSKIVSKYLIYALLASVIGALLGIPVGMMIYPTIIYSTWKLMYHLPDMMMVMPIWIFVLGVLSFALLMMFVTYIVARDTLKAKPAELMRPKAPKEGKKILLEKIPFIWKHFSFITKINARNIFRYKSRFFMTVIGVAGCTSLLVLGFGIKDSIADIIDIQYGEVFNYNETITLDDDDYTSELLDDLKDDPNIESAVAFREFSTKVYIDDEPTITLEVFDSEDIKEVIDLRERKTHDALDITDGVVVSEKFATSHGIEVGDIVTIESANGIRKEVEVTGICEIYFQHYMFISDTTYETLFSEKVHEDKIAVIAKDTELLKTDYEDLGYIESIVDFSGVVDNFQTMIGALDFIILVIILAAGSLALVVLINLSEVNISERIREIATFKVLGFYDREVNSYIFKELLFLTVIGALCGLPLGKIEHTFVMKVIDMDMVMYGENIALISYVYGFVITLAFTIIVAIVMARTLRKVKMVESLKSVE